MIGLVLKDALVMRKTLRSYVLFLIFYAALAFMGVFPISIVTGMIQVILTLLPISAFSYDEWAKWDRYALSMPLSRQKVVGARYLFALLLALVSAVFGLLLCVLLSILTGPQTMGENLAGVLVCLGTGLFIADLLLPLCYKLGPERARPYLYAIVFLPLIAFFGAFKLGFLDGLNLSGIPDSSAILFFSLFTLAAVAGLGISYRISCRIMAKKEV